MSGSKDTERKHKSLDMSCISKEFISMQIHFEVGSFLSLFINKVFDFPFLSV